MTKRIAIVAGEASGDLLAARLIHSLKAQYPDCQFEGIAGPEMLAAGCQGLYPLEKLSIMGLTEVLKHLPELLSIRRALIKHWQANPPDLFIGVDAPDFNLPLAKRLHASGILSVHYVSPSVWAWREKRVRKMQGNLDLMLCLFPFEVDFYHKHHINAVFVGHPLADEIEFNAVPEPARTRLGLDTQAPVLALLPGSRHGELQRLAPDFLQAAALLQQQQPSLQVLSPAASPKLAAYLLELKQQYAPDLNLTLVQGQSRLVMQAADVMLVASGTAVLEGMLSGRLMVAAYRVAPLTMWLLRTFKLLKVKYVTLPNNLANEALVPEILQEAVTPQALAKALQAQFNLDAERKTYVLQRFQQLHVELKQNASQAAATAVSERFCPHE